MSRRPSPLLRSVAGLGLALAIAACQPGVGRNTAQVGQPKGQAAAAQAGAAAKAPAAATRAPRSGNRPSRLDEVQRLDPVPARGGLVAPPAAMGRRFTALPDGAGDLAGDVRFLSVDDAFFKDSAAYRLNALGAAEHALVSLSTLDEDVFTQGGQVVRATTDAGGTFSLTGATPPGAPFVVAAGFARGHRLTAIARPDATEVVVDEATSMVTELARWQLFPFEVENDADITDVEEGHLTDLHAQTRTLLADVEIPSTGGDAPVIAALQTGAGHVLRNLYVEAFGSKVTDGGTSVPAVANTLSDLWQEVLSFRPLALTRVAGNGVRGFNQSDGRLAVETELTTPIDAVEDHLGNVYTTQLDVHLISLVPKADLPWNGLLGSNATDLDGGNLYTVAGVVNGPADPLSWDAVFADASADDPAGAPSMAGGFPIYAPYKLALEKRAGGDESHIYFTSPFVGRVMFMATENVTHFGQDFEANHLYALAGSRSYNPNDPFTPLANGDAGTGGGLYFPTGLQRDAAGNLWVLDSGIQGEAGTAGIVLIRETDGTAWRIPLAQGADPYTPDGALDLRLDPGGNFVYVADTERHFVFKFPRPSQAAIADFDNVAPAACQIERVTGKPDVRGFIDVDVDGVLYPEIHNASDGIDDVPGDLTTDGGAVAPDDVTALLNRPGSITFDKDGNLVIGDAGNGRIRLLANNKLYTIAGGLDTRFITGDARLGYFPGLTSVNLAADDTLLVADRRESVVRRVHTNRGSL